MPQSATLFLLQLIYTIGALGLAAYGLQAIVLTLLRVRSDRSTPYAPNDSRRAARPAPGRDDTDWPAVMAELRGIGFDGALVSEVGGDDDNMRQTAERIRRIIDL